MPVWAMLSATCCGDSMTLAPRASSTSAESSRRLFTRRSFAGQSVERDNSFTGTPSFSPTAAMPDTRATSANGSIPGLSPIVTEQPRSSRARQTDPTSAGCVVTHDSGERAASMLALTRTRSPCENACRLSASRTIGSSEAAEYSSQCQRATTDMAFSPLNRFAAILTVPAPDFKAFFRLTARQKRGTM